MAAKLGLGFFVVAAVFVVALGSFATSLDSTQSSYSFLVNNIAAKKAAAQNIESMMLQCRRAEKDFIARKNMKYPKRITALVADIQSRLILFPALKKPLGTRLAFRPLLIFVVI